MHVDVDLTVILYSPIGCVFGKMNILNVCAVNSGEIVYPWKIPPISVPGVSITDFFFSKVEPEHPSFDAYDLVVFLKLIKICGKLLS